MKESILTTSATARLLAELGTPKSEGWVRHAASTGKLPCITTTTGRRLFRQSDVLEFVRRVNHPRRQREKAAGRNPTEEAARE